MALRISSVWKSCHIPEVLPASRLCILTCSLPFQQRLRGAASEPGCAREERRGGNGAEAGWKQS